MTHPLRQEYLVSYDISNNKLRTKIFNELSKLGLKPVQKSVFWGYLTTAETEAIKRFLKTNFRSTDKVFITRTNFNGRGKSFFIGYSAKDFKDWNETEVI